MAEARVFDDEPGRDVTWDVLSGHINDLIVLADLSGTIFYVSPSCRRLGYQQQDLIGRQAVELIHPDDLEHANANVAAMFAGGAGRELAEREHRYRRKDGSWVWLQGNPAPLPDGRGGVVGMINVFRDVSEARAVRERLEDSERRYRLITENATDMISRTAVHNGRLTYLSPSAAGVTGYSPAELIGKRMQDYVHPDDLADFLSAFGGLMSGAREGDRPIRFRARHKDGSWLWLESNPRLLRAADGTPTDIIDVTRDVGEQHRLKVQLSEALAEAETLTQVKSEFIANMSHEIRTPLTAVLGFTSLLAERPGLDETARSHVERIAGAGRGLLAIVNDVLDFSKLDAGEVAISPQPTDAARCAREVLQMFEPQAKAKGLTLRFEAQATVPPRVMIDADRLRQVLTNLIGNAVKFTERGSVAALVTYDEKAGRLTVEVVDTGPGIPTAAREKLFRRFSQVDGSSTRAKGGAGLGLAICRRLAEAMDGEVTVKSRVGRGSIFRLEVAAPATAEIALAPAGEAVAALLDGLRVLVVDDNATNRELARAMLEPFGAEVSEAVDGVEAVAMAEALPVDVILMDLRMPGLDGRQALAEIRCGGGPNQDTPILSFSADCDPSAESAFDGHVSKPVSPTDMIAAIGRALREPAADHLEDEQHVAA